MEKEDFVVFKLVPILPGYAETKLLCFILQKNIELCFIICVDFDLGVYIFFSKCATEIKLEDCH